jgi:hypothetical protein
MKTSYDMSRANAVIDEYLGALADSSKIPGRIGRTWLEFCMERNKMIPDVRKLGFGESHALWYAALVRTKRLREVSRAERAAMPNSPTKTETTVRNFFKRGSKNFNTITAAYVRALTAHE